MEYCEHGDLGDYLRNHGRLSEAEAQDVARQLLVGVSLMHRAGFAHRDIKPKVSMDFLQLYQCDGITKTHSAQNIFVKSVPPAHWWVKLGDLGLSKRVEAISGPSTVQGTPGFIPPELYGMTREDPKNLDPFCADIWCLAETVFRMLTDQETFDSFVKLNDYVGRRIPFPKDALNEVNTSESGVDFVQSLMAPFPLERMTAEQALKHPWILLDDDAKSDGDDVASVQGNATVASISSSGDEDITQPVTHWTSDVGTADLEILSKLSVKGDEAGGNTIRHEQQLISLGLKRTIRMACRSKHQAYVEDGSEDSNTDNSAYIITHSLLAGVKKPTVSGHADEDMMGNHFTGKEAGETEAAGIHEESEDTDKISVSSSARFMPTAQRHRPSITRSPDFGRPRSESPKKRSLDSSGQTYEPQIVSESTQDQDLQQVEGMTEMETRRHLRPKTPPKGRRKSGHDASMFVTDSRQHARSDKYDLFSVSTLGIGEEPGFTSISANLVSKRVLDDVLGYDYQHVVSGE